MKQIEVSTGRVISFPDELSDDRIVALLRERYPARLEPGQVRLGENGSQVHFDAALAHFVVHDYAGVCRGYRAAIVDALRLADGLQGKPAEKQIKGGRGRYHVETPPRPQPVLSIDCGPISTAYREVDSHINMQQGRARRAAIYERQNGRPKNYGTTR